MVTTLLGTVLIKFIDNPLYNPDHPSKLTIFLVV